VENLSPEQQAARSRYERLLDDIGKMEEVLTSLRSDLDDAIIQCENLKVYDGSGAKEPRTRAVLKPRDIVRIIDTGHQYFWRCAEVVAASGVPGTKITVKLPGDPLGREWELDRGQLSEQPMTNSLSSVRAMMVARRLWKE
jgi:hypothetical protein